MAYPAGDRKFESAILTALALAYVALASGDRVMLRVLGGLGDPATRIENRVGEPAANPYLYAASQIIAGLAGIEGACDPGPPDDEPYAAARPLLRVAMLGVVSLFYVLHALVHVTDTIAGRLPPSHWTIDLPGVYVPALLMLGITWAASRARVPS